MLIKETMDDTLFYSVWFVIDLVYKIKEKRSNGSKREILQNRGSNFLRF